MKRLLVAALILLALPACGDAVAQIVRPAATPRAAATARPVASPGRIPEAGDFPTVDLVLHLAADTDIYEDAVGTDAAETADRVRAWRDQSANAYLFVEDSAIGSFPVYVASDTVAGYGSVQFASGATTFLEKTGVTDLISGGLAVTFGFVAGKAGTTNSLFSQDEGSGSTDKWIVDNGWASGGGVHLNGNEGAANLTGLSLDASVFAVWTFRREADGVWEWRKDGVVTGTGTSLVELSRPNTGPISIGEAEGNVGDYRLSELLIYNGALSDSGLDDLETYLSARK